jgi:hypothetical protein
MPHQIAGLTVRDGPMVRDARDATEGVVAIVTRRVHLTDDCMFGAGNGGQRGHRTAHAVTPVMRPHGFQRSGGRAALIPLSR